LLHATGPENIPTKFIKIVVDFIAGRLTKIINDSIKPDQFSLIVGNYRESLLYIPKVAANSYFTSALKNVSYPIKL
jgi:hypothetical protein